MIEYGQKVVIVLIFVYVFFMQTTKSRPGVEISLIPSSSNILQVIQCHSIAYSSGNSSFLSASGQNNSPVLIDLKTESVRSFQNNKKSIDEIITAITIDEEGKYVVTGHHDGTVCIYSAKDNYSLIFKHKSFHKNIITSLSFYDNTRMFYVGDVNGLVTKIHFGTTFLSPIKEVPIFQGFTNVVNFMFTSSSFSEKLGFIVLKNSFLIIDPSKPKEQTILQKSPDFNGTPYIVTQEDWHGKINIFAFFSNVCHYYQFTKNKLQDIGSISLFKNANEFVINAKLWNSKLILFVNNNFIIKFINISDLITSIQMKDYSYSSKLIHRKQSPLSQAILSSSIYLHVYNEILFIITSRNAIKMTFRPWYHTFKKLKRNQKWDEAFLLLSDVISFKTLDVIGMPNARSQQNASVKKVARKLILERIQWVMSIPHQSENIERNNVIEYENEIKNSLTASIRLASMVSLQQYITNDILSILEQNNCDKYLYSILFNNQTIDSSEYIDPQLINKYLSMAQKNGLMEESQNNLLEIQIPKIYAYDISALIYNFGLLKLFCRIVAFAFTDYITPCIILQDDFQKLETYLKLIFLNYKEIIKHKYSSDELNNIKSQKMLKNAQKSVIIWLFFPNIDGQFHRFAAVLDRNSELAVGILKTTLQQLPIKYTLSKNSEFSANHLADCIMHILNNIQETDENKYNKYYKILKIACSLYCLPNVEITLCALPLLLYWIFNNKREKFDLRIYILKKITQRFPTLIDQEDFFQFSLNSGFRFAIEDKYARELEQQYDMILKHMIINKSERANVFQFINELINLQESNKNIRPYVRSTIINNAAALTLINSSTLVSIVSKNYPTFHQIIIYKSLKTNLQKYLYLNSLYAFYNDSSEEGKKTYEIDINDLFSLTCEFNPSSAISFLKEHSDERSSKELRVLDHKKAFSACIQYNVNDCLVALSRVSNNPESAIKAVEKSLVDIIKTDEINNISISSESEFCMYPLLMTALSAIDELLIFQKELIPQSSSFENLIFFNAFTFPLYLSYKGSNNIKKIILLLFTHFLVESAEIIPIQFLLGNMFKQINYYGFSDIREILKQLSGQIDFKEKVSKILVEMLADDTLSLRENVFVRSTSGRKSSNYIRCASCMSPITLQDTNIFIFPCGHIFHDKKECLNSYQYDDKEYAPSKPEQCPICACGKSEDINENVLLTTKNAKLSKGMVRSLLRKFNFILKPNYGENVNFRPSSAYFVPEPSDVAADILVLDKISVSEKPININIDLAS